MTLNFVLTTLLLVSVAAAQDTGREEITPDLRVERIAPGVWRHVSCRVLEQYGRVAANGILVVGTDTAIMVDTPWDDAQTAALFDWTKRRLGIEVGHVIVTHYHIDCMGGLPRPTGEVRNPTRWR